MIKAFFSCLIVFVHFQSIAQESTPLDLSKQDLSDIGHQIYLNETGGNQRYLIAWNEGESFASLGIGHFIWFPEGLQSPFTETFPELIEYMQTQNVALPKWLLNQQDSPWSHLKAFEQARQNDPRMQSLESLLLDTFDVQLAFILERMQAALPLMLMHTESPKQSALIEQRFKQLMETKTGAYSLVDYVNFKGEGTSEKERYKGQGWGLKQVLLNIDESKGIHDAFADACFFVLNRRVENSPQADVEEKWLDGWKKRCDTYREF